MLCFPFSVAATNLFLGLLLVTGLLAGLWWQGVGRLWQGHRRLFIVLLAYLALIPLGLLWSIDPAWGGHILARHWFWLLLPVVVAVLGNERNRNAFLAVMSLALVANLVFCVLQANGLVASPNVAGSTMDNATGHIGHTSFGFIYGIWSAWLLHWGLVRQGKQAWLAWGVAIWAVAMVFMAQGESGYIITIFLLLLVAVKWSIYSSARKVVMLAITLLLIAGTLVMLGPGKERIQGTWQALTQSSQQKDNAIQGGARASAQARLAWWSMSIDIWRQGSFWGVGTGGFPKAVRVWQAHPALQHGYINAFSQVKIAHPHNQYLITLVRYGLIGLILLLILIAAWIGSGVRGQWRDVLVAPLIALSGVALLIHGLDSTSFEEHFSSIFALIILGTGLSECKT